jgi:hypothetical protein
MPAALIAAAFLLLAQDAAVDGPAPPPCDTDLQVCPVIDPATGRSRVYPADVDRFQQDVETCLHFAGEEPYDAARRKEIDAAIAEHCDGAKARLPGLRKRYRDDPEALERIEAIQAFRIDAGL